MRRTATKAQQARARASRLALLEKRNVQDERIEAATAAVLLAWRDRSAAQGRVEQAERAAAAAVGLLCREKVLVPGHGGADWDRATDRPAAAVGSRTSRQLDGRGRRL